MRFVQLALVAVLGLGCGNDGTARPVVADATAHDGLLLSECVYRGEVDGLPLYGCECAGTVTLLDSYAQDKNGACIAFLDGCQPDDVTRMLKKDCLK